jgi:outer membrane protein assembly factor BamD
MFVCENFKDLPEIFKYCNQRAELSYLEYQKTLSDAERKQTEGRWQKFKKWL